jgi:hypothetical protein
MPLPLNAALWSGTDGHVEKQAGEAGLGVRKSGSRSVMMSIIAHQPNPSVPFINGEYLFSYYNITVISVNILF